mmetsp:Transcript_36859/g.84985  ORF Transcript_36859/g.84985 Transcript_36859/m.84985 type:complete len:201 (+) Transcript_36859:217-819(+)
MLHKSLYALELSFQLVFCCARQRLQTHNPGTRLYWMKLHLQLVLKRHKASDRANAACTWPPMPCKSLFAVNVQQDHLRRQVCDTKACALRVCNGSLHLTQPSTVACLQAQHHAFHQPEPSLLPPVCAPTSLNDNRVRRLHRSLRRCLRCTHLCQDALGQRTSKHVSPPPLDPLNAAHFAVQRLSCDMPSPHCADSSACHL